jgi:hypothetical protein
MSVGQAHAALKRAEQDASQPNLPSGRRQACQRQVEQARQKLEREVSEAVRDMEKAGYQVTVRASR